MLFNWFKKKDKLVPLEPSEFKQKQVKPEHKPLSRLIDPPDDLPPESIRGGRAGKTRKPTPVAKDTTKINTSESSVIRIGKLGEVLLQYNMISRENLEKALALQQQSFIRSGPQDNAVQKRKLLGEILMENNFVTEEQLLSAFARHCRIPYIKLNKYGLPKEAIKSVPEDLIIKHKIMPIDKIGSMLMLAVTDPYDTNAVEEVKAKTGLKVKTILCKQSEFAEMVKFYYPHINEKSGETSADIASEVAPEGATSDNSVPAEPRPECFRGAGSGEKPKTTQESLYLGEKTAVFKIEELPFPEPPPTARQPTETKQAKTITEKTIQASVSPQYPESIRGAGSNGVSQTTPPEFFLDGTVEETAPPVAPQPYQAQEVVQGESKSPAQETPVETSETPEVSDDDTSLINIQDLVTSKQITLDENIKIMPEEPEPFVPQDEPINVAPYIYPEEKQAKEIPEPPPKTSVDATKEVKNGRESPPHQVAATDKVSATDRETVHQAPVRLRSSGGEEKPPRNNRDSVATSQPTPIPAFASTGNEKPEKEIFKENPVLVSDDEFLVARQLFTTQLAHSWEKLYHRSKPSHAEKVDETEFAFYTESAIR